MSGWLINVVPLLLICAGQAEPPDRYCGSRAVHFVCRHYGMQKMDLIDVIRDLQPEVDADGARLSDMNEFLVRQGIWAVPMTIELSAIDEILEPIILFFPEHKRNPAHYVVLLPQKIGRKVTLWSGLAGKIEMNVGDLRRRMSGECLVTARSAPSEWEEVIVFRQRSPVVFNWRRAIAAWLVLFSAALVCRRISLGNPFSKEAVR